MNNVKVIVIAINSETSPCRMSCKSTLFKPLYLYTVEQLKKAGFEKITVAGDVCDKIENGVSYEYVENAGLQTIFDHVCKTTENKALNLLFIYGDVTYINADLLESAISRFNDDNIPAIIKDEESRLSAGVLLPFSEMEKLDHKVTSLHRIMDLYGEHMKYTVTTNRILSPKVLLAFSEKMRESIIMHHMDNGVIFTSIDAVIISPSASIAPGVTINSGCNIKGNSKIMKNALIGPNSVIEDSVIGENTKIINSYVTKSTVQDGADIGPYSNIRPNCNIGKNVHIGDFVEIKNSNIGDKTKVAHLTYIGDSDVGEDVNFGCGVVTVNYDGKNKYRTKIGNRVFVGCNTNFIAPVTVEDDTYIAAGSTITDTVPSGSLAIARARQTIKENWVKNRKEQQQ